MTIARRSMLAATVALLGPPLFAPSIARGQSTIVLRWGDVQAPTHPSVQAAGRTAKEVKKKTSGRVEIQTFPSGQLGGSRDMVKATSSGAMGIVTEGGALIGQFLPQMSIIEAPYIPKDAAQMSRALASPFVGELNKSLIDKRDLRIVASHCYGKRHLTTGSKPVRTAADMVGFKLRVPEVDTFVAMTEAWGAKATLLNFGELYLALSRCAVDGQENPLPTIQAGKLFEVQKYLVLTGHIITPRLVVANETLWKKLTPADRDAVTVAIRSNAAWNDAEIVRQESTLADTFQKAGMTVIEPDVESFRKPVLASVPRKFEAEWDKGLWERLQAL